MKNRPLIIYEDDSIVAANKPARLVSVPAPSVGLGGTLLGRVRREAAKTMDERSCPVFPLHRLDYATSGIVLFGKNPKERIALESIHRQSETDKIYLALVRGSPPAQGRMDFPVPARSRNILTDAHTEYRVLVREERVKCALVEVKILTGRRHQIRRHFAGIGFPVVLDDAYGNRKFNQWFRCQFHLGRHFLHAWKFSFRHPITGKYIRLAAPLAPDLALVLKRLNILLPIV